MTVQQAILLVEDNDDDAELTTRAFTQAHIANPIVRVGDGIAALDYLFFRGEHAQRPPAVPAVVLLDVKLPKLGGLEVLQAIRADDRTRHIPVVMLTSSTEESDRLTAYDRCANSYVRKPVDYDQFVTAAGQLGLYWVLLNQPAPRRT